MYQEFAQSVENMAKSVMNDIHTALPGKIMSFSPEKGTAVVKPAGKYLTSDGVSLEYPVISGAPLMFPYCGTASVGLTFPVKTGDDCLIIVSETDLDEWLSGAESEAPLRYDLTSAIVIPGLMPVGNAAMAKANARDAVVIISGAAEIVIANGKIDIKGDVTFDGNVSVNGILTVGNINLNTHRHISAMPGQKSGKPQNE